MQIFSPEAGLEPQAGTVGVMGEVQPGAKLNDKEENVMVVLPPVTNGSERDILDRTINN